jgi:hypothetical protein
MSAALKDVEPKMASATGTLAEEARRRLHVASEHIEKAVKLWREAIEQQKQGTSWRTTRKLSNRHVRHSRREWKAAVRMLQTA